MKKDVFPISLLTSGTGARFCHEVEEIVKKHEIGYLEAVIQLCERRNIEPESAAKLLSKPIIEKIQIEGQEMHLLPQPGGVLPI